MNDFPVFVMTYREKTIPLLKLLDADQIQRRVRLVVDAVDYAYWATQVPEGILVNCPVQGQGAAVVRQWIHDHAPERYVQMDSDLMFRCFTAPRKSQVITGTQFLLILDEIFEEMAKVGAPIGGGTHTYMNNGEVHWRYDAPVYWLFCLDKSKLPVTVRWDGIETFEDTWFDFQIAELGLPSVVNCWLLIHNPPFRVGSGETTGDRAGKGIRAAEFLATRFPGCVKILPPTAIRVSSGVKLIKYYSKLRKRAQQARGLLE